MEHKVEIKDIRVAEGLSQADFAKKYQIPVRTLQEWEQGRSKPPAYVESMIRWMSVHRSLEERLEAFYGKPIEDILSVESDSDKDYPSIDELFAEYDGDYKPEEMAAAGMLEKEIIKSIPIYGVVEGFYGRAWTFEDRCSMIDFMAGVGMNTYIYAPKNDPYHREFWRLPYPESERAELRRLLSFARERGVELIFAVSPGMGLRYEDGAFEEDAAVLIGKLAAMHELGFRRFAVFFDDIEAADGGRQAALLNLVNREFVRRYEGVGPLITVPTEYFTENIFRGGEVKPYSAAFAAGLDEDIVVLFTGREVCPDGLSRGDVSLFRSVYGDRPIGLWWNYPVNDYLPSKPALGPIDIDASEAIEGVSCFFMNPMDRVEMSKIALYTGADFARDPAGYDAEASWVCAIDELFGDLADEMRLFASEHQRLEGRFAHIGRDDAPELARMYEGFWDDARGAKELIAALEDYVLAYRRLRERLPEKYLAEIAGNLDNQIDSKSKNIELLGSFIAGEIDADAARSGIKENLCKIEDSYESKILFPV